MPRRPDRQSASLWNRKIDPQTPSIRTQAWLAGSWDNMDVWYKPLGSAPRSCHLGGEKEVLQKFCRYWRPMNFEYSW